MPTDLKYIASHFERPGTYRIRVRGVVDPKWSDWLGGMHISPHFLESKDVTTELVGLLSDQAALVGVLNALYDMHLSIVSVECLPDESLKDECKR